jgi:hypothetical protein
MAGALLVFVAANSPSSLFFFQKDRLLAIAELSARINEASARRSVFFAVFVNTRHSVRFAEQE